MIVRFMKVLFLICIISTLIGCASKKGSLYQGDLHSKTIQMAEYSVVFTDKRPNPERRELSVPVLSVPWQEDKVSPVFNKQLEELFHSVMRRFQAEGGTVLVFEVDIDEAYQEFVADAFSESEAVSWKISVRVREQGNDNQISQSQGACWGRRDSLDASPVMIDEMYNHCFEIAVTDALNNLTLN